MLLDNVLDNVFGVLLDNALGLNLVKICEALKIKHVFPVKNMAFKKSTNREKNVNSSF